MTNENDEARREGIGCIMILMFIFYFFMFILTDYRFERLENLHPEMESGQCPPSKS